MLFAYFPTLTALKMGQDSVITTFLLVETFVSLKGKRYAIAGGLLALGLYKPQFVYRWSGYFCYTAAGRRYLGVCLRDCCLACSY